MYALLKLMEVHWEISWQERNSIRHHFYILSSFCSFLCISAKYIRNSVRQTCFKQKEVPGCVVSASILIELLRAVVDKLGGEGKDTCTGKVKVT
jgi:hypothetical protein